MEENFMEREEEITTEESNGTSGKTILLIGGAIGALALGAYALLKKRKSKDPEILEADFKEVKETVEEEESEDNTEEE